METDSAPPSLGRLLNFSAGASNRLCQKLLAPAGLSLGQWVILSALWRRDGQLISELARYSGNNLPAASRIVDRMERSGLVARRADAVDRRAVRVHVTEAGRASAHLAEFWVEVNARLMQDFTEEETATLLSLLERVLANARAGTREPESGPGGDNLV